MGLRFQTLFSISALLLVFSLGHSAKASKKTDLAVDQMMDRNRCAVAAHMALPDDWIETRINKDVEQPQAIQDLRKSLQRYGAEKTFLNQEVLARDNNTFSKELKVGMAPNQRKTGSCWVHGGFDAILPGLISRGRVPATFEFSQSYTWFLHLTEQSNAHFNQIILNGNAIREGIKKERKTLVAEIAQGGAFQDFKYLYKKYGCVPASVMKKKAVFSNPKFMLQDLDRTVALTSRKLAEAIKSGARVKDLMKIKKEGNRAVWSVLSNHLGRPEKSFKIPIKDLDPSRLPPEKRNLKFVSFTPIEFRDYLGIDMDDYVVVGSYPLLTKNKRYLKKVNPKEAAEEYADLEFVNVDHKKMMELTDRSVDGGEGAYFSSDFSRDVDRKTGIMHPDIYQRAQLYGLTKEEAQMQFGQKDLNYYKISKANHGMAIVGYDRPVPEGEILKRKVMNSHGTKVGVDGFYKMYSAWSDENVYRVVVLKKFLDEEELEVLRNEPVIVKKGTEIE